MAWRLKEKAKAKADATTMTVVEHLTELRDRLIWSAVAVALGAIVAFTFFDWVLGFMVDPYTDLTGRDRLIFTQPMEGFFTRIKFAAYGGLVLASPVVFWHLWRFVTPGLHANEKRYAVPFVVSSVILFAGGATLAMLTLPRALEFLMGVGGANLEPLLTAGSYLSLVFLMAVAFGFAFQFPILVVFLLLARVLTTAQLRQWRRHTFLAVVIIAAVITPSQDPITLFALALPMYILYEGALVVGRFMHR